MSNSQNHEISYCKIFPTIGFARLGNSPDEYFIGPEIPGRVSEPADKRYKDGEGRVKRQAARFRLFGFNEEGVAVKEMTSDLDDVESIIWTVGLANKKASWHQFNGAAGVAAILKGSDQDKPNLRNLDIEDTNERLKLNIDAGESSIQGENKIGPKMEGLFLDKSEPVYLGQLRTDERGRVLVLGGHGVSDSIDDDNPINHYANNDRWYDDTSDGPVMAKITMTSGRSIEVKGRSWVVISTPDYSPYTPNIVTLYDALLQAVLDHDIPWPETELGARPNPEPTVISFYDDIYPILYRTSMYQWVSKKAARGHGTGKGGDFMNPRILAVLSDPEVAADKQSPQKKILSRIRCPHWYPMMPEHKKSSDILLNPESIEAIHQANLYFMPALSGDQGTTRHERSLSWMTLTELQYRRLKCWADGTFNAPDISEPPTPHTTLEGYDMKDRPAALTRAALEACQGGAFFPGIEMTSICRDPEFYSEAFRINDHYEAGDINKWMALPWQADFYECSDNWWPAVRPDEVVDYFDFKKILSEFEDQAQGGTIKNMLSERKNWARGLIVDSVARPALPLAERGQNPIEYHNMAQVFLDRLRIFYLSGFMSRLGRQGDVTAAMRMRAQAYIEATILFRPDFELAPINNLPGDRYRKIAHDALNSFIKKAFKLPEPLLTSENLDYPAEDYSNRVNRAITGGSVYEGIVNLEWRQRQGFNGDNQMVEKWHRLGFVKPHITPYGEFVYVETERAHYDMLRYRDYFYILQNEESYPDFRLKAMELAETFLRLGREQYPDLRSSHYASFTYSEESLRARMAQIYENNRIAAIDFNPVTGAGTLFKTPDEVKQRIRQLAPFNQMDGSWLRNISKAGPTDQIRSLLSEIWNDEIGNGDPAQNHANVYTDLLHSASIYLPPVNSKAYAEHPEFWGESFSGAVYHHAISTFPETYFPELLGMTLYLEWEANFLAAMVKLYDYHGYNSLFYKLHVAIDNTVNGHAAQTLKAVKMYMDHVRGESGEVEMQEHWNRIWNGYISFLTVGGTPFRYMFENPSTLERQMVEMIVRKKKYGQLNHGSKRLGVNQINDWFDMPMTFLNTLANSHFITRGNARKSKFLQLLNTTGPMLKVFSVEERQLVEDWINSLRPTPTGDVLSTGRAMEILLEKMRGKGIGELAHANNQLKGPDPTPGNEGEVITKPVSWWFQLNQPKLFMAALRDPDNGWIIRKNAADSRFVSELLSDSGKMARLLIDPILEAGNFTGRIIIIDWINDDCPIPGEAALEETKMTFEEASHLVAANKLDPILEAALLEEIAGALHPPVQRTPEEHHAYTQACSKAGGGANH